MDANAEYTEHAKGWARHFRRRLAMAGQAVRAARFFCRKKEQRAQNEDESA
jgi:hypothetical protein